MCIYFGFYSLLFYLIFDGGHALLTCKDENNKDIDWYIILKFPASYNYFYLSSASNSGKWLTPDYAINDNRNLLAVTLNQVYESKKNSAFFALYNDDRPRRSSHYSRSRSGHLKGALNFDGKTGYWLVHSVPKFPNKNKYEYTNGESMNGQSFICVSLDVRYLKSIATQLLMMYSDVYSYNLPTNFSSDSDLTDKLYKLVMNEHTQGVKSQNIKMSTLNNVALSHFGKSAADFIDVYSGLISPGTNTSLCVESWMKSAGDKIPTDCSSSNKVYNVRKVSINGIEFSETVDHSKWAVSESQKQPVVCIGDLNRMVDQMKRGGGSLCIFSPFIWKLFFPIVKDYEPCPKPYFVM